MRRARPGCSRSRRACRRSRNKPPSRIPGPNVNGPLRSGPEGVEHDNRCGSAEVIRSRHLYGVQRGTPRRFHAGCRVVPPTTCKTRQRGARQVDAPASARMSCLTCHAPASEATRAGLCSASSTSHPRRPTEPARPSTQWAVDVANRLATTHQAGVGAAFCSPSPPPAPSAVSAAPGSGSDHSVIFSTRPRISTSPNSTMSSGGFRNASLVSPEKRS